MAGIFLKGYTFVFQRCSVLQTGAVKASLLFLFPTSSIKNKQVSANYGF